MSLFCEVFLWVRLIQILEISHLDLYDSINALRVVGNGMSSDSSRNFHNLGIDFEKLGVIIQV